MKTRIKLISGLAVMVLALFLVKCDIGTTPYVEDMPEASGMPKELVARWYISQASADESKGKQVLEFTPDNKAIAADSGNLLFDVSVEGDSIRVHGGPNGLKGKMKYSLIGTELSIYESTSLVFKDGTYYKKSERKKT